MQTINPITGRYTATNTFARDPVVDGTHRNMLLVITGWLLSDPGIAWPLCSEDDEQAPEVTPVNVSTVTIFDPVSQVEITPDAVTVSRDGLNINWETLEPTTAPLQFKINPDESWPRLENKTLSPIPANLLIFSLDYSVSGATYTLSKSRPRQTTREDDPGEFAYEISFALRSSKPRAKAWKTITPTPSSHVNCEWTLADEQGFVFATTEDCWVNDGRILFSFEADFSVPKGSNVILTCVTTETMPLCDNGGSNWETPTPTKFKWTQDDPTAPQPN